MPGPIRTFTPLVGTPNSINANINSLVLNTQWASGQLTYSFPTDSSQYTGYGPTDEPFVGFEAAGTPYKAAVQFTFRTVSEFTNATFTEIAPSATNIPTMRFGITGDPAPRPGTTADLAGWAYLPADTAIAGDVWIVARQNMNTPFAVGDFRWSLVIHEMAMLSASVTLLSRGPPAATWSWIRHGIPPNTRSWPIGLRLRFRLSTPWVSQRRAASPRPG